MTEEDGGTTPEQKQALIQRLTMYRLRARVEVAADDRPVFASWPGVADGFVADPRNAADYRAILLGPYLFGLTYFAALAHPTRSLRVPGQSGSARLADTIPRQRHGLRILRGQDRHRRQADRGRGGRIGLRRRRQPDRDA